MGKDLIHKRCLGDNARCADLLNGLLFAGRQAICPEDLEELDSTTDSKKQRDMLKKAACGAKFYVFGVENQEKVHYLMPLRSMLYDALEYDRQARARAKQLRSVRKCREKQAECGENAANSDAEYLMVLARWTN